MFVKFHLLQATVHSKNTFAKATRRFSVRTISLKFEHFKPLLPRALYRSPAFASRRTSTHCTQLQCALVCILSLWALCAEPYPTQSVSMQATRCMSYARVNKIKSKFLKSYNCTSSTLIWHRIERDFSFFQCLFVPVRHVGWCEWWVNFGILVKQFSLNLDFL